MQTLSNVTHALERAWSAIRTVHPDAAPAVLVVFRHPKGDRRGHYWREAWRTRSDNGPNGNGSIDEVHISSTILDEGAESVMQTLLHEAVHSIAQVRGIQDTSRQGRWHNKRFAELAGVLGLVVEKNGSIGHITPGITDEAKSRFRNVIDELETAITLYQERPKRVGNGKGKGPGTGPNGKGSKSRMIKATCPMCKRIIRASAKTFEQGPILCVPCSIEAGDLEKACFVPEIMN